jgi:hypothetical protein
MLKKIITWKRFYILFFAILSAAILGPLLLPGPVLTLDTFSGPNEGLSSTFFGLTPNVQQIVRLPFFLLQFAVIHVFPFWLWQKIIFFLIFFLSGVGAYRLFRLKGLSAYFTGIIYVLNPFTYARFLAGQWTVLAIYALAPFAIMAFITLLEQRNLCNVIKVVLLTTLAGSIYEHGFPLLFPIFLVIWLVKITNLHQRDEVKSILNYTGITIGLLFLLNCYWIIPLLTSKSTILQQIGTSDIAAFAPISTSNSGILFDLVSMMGFWRGGYLYISNLFPFWWVFVLFILYLSVLGFTSNFRDKGIGWIVKSLGILWLVGLVLAAGAANNLTKPIFEWLWQNIPYFSVFRDSQKFISLLCLSYAILGGLGVTEIIRILNHQKQRFTRFTMTMVLVLAMITPVIYSFTEFGFSGQLTVTNYPQGWYQVNDYLNQHKEDFSVLFLPWHQYMTYSWLRNKGDNKLGNPARTFFNKPIIQGDNLEIADIYSENTNPISKYVEYILSKGPQVTNLGELFSPLNARYIILVNETDYLTYNYLYKQDDLKIVIQQPGITLFENEHITARTYATNSLVHIQSLDDYLELSQTQDVMEHIYVLDNGINTFTNGSFNKINTLENSPISYQLEATPGNYTVFVVSQDNTTENWEYNGQETVFNNLSFMPVFKSSPEGGKVVYSRFYRIYIPGYIISSLTAGIIIFLFFLSRKKKI